ncbi:MAG: hypothetical protein WC934_04800 [Acidithiobacillus sp.]
MKKRTNTISCNSVFNPKNKTLQETKDILQCSINLVEEKDWEKYKKDIKTTDVQKVTTFQLEVDTNVLKKDYEIKLEHLCNAENVECKNVLPTEYMQKFTELLTPIISKLNSSPISLSPSLLSKPPSSKPSLTPPPSLPVSSLGKPPTAPPSNIKVLSSSLSQNELGSLKLSSVTKEPEKIREKTPEEIEQENERKRQGMLSKLNADIAGSGISMIKDKDTCSAIGDTLASKYNNEAFTHFAEIPDNEYYSINTNKGIGEKTCNLLNTNKELVGSPYTFKFQLNPFERKPEIKQTCKILYDNEPITDNNAELLQKKIDDLSEKGKFPQYVYGGNLEIKKIKVNGLKSCVPAHNLFGQLTSTLPYDICEVLEKDKDYIQKLKDIGFELKLNVKAQTCDTKPIKKEEKK